MPDKDGARDKARHCGESSRLEPHDPHGLSCESRWHESSFAHAPRAVSQLPRGGGFLMNWQQIEGKWDQVEGDVKSAWGKLTDDDLVWVSGKREKLIGKVQERYGVMKDQAQKQVDEWFTRVTEKIDKIGSKHS